VRTSTGTWPSRSGESHTRQRFLQDSGPTVTALAKTESNCTSKFSNTFLRNVGSHKSHTASHPRKRHSSRMSTFNAVLFTSETPIWAVVTRVRWAVWHHAGPSSTNLFTRRSTRDLLRHSVAGPLAFTGGWGLEAVSSLITAKYFLGFCYN
jgi:hypothetical protein